MVRKNPGLWFAALTQYQMVIEIIYPYYKTSNRLKGKHVVVVDDCTTYGVSFGVAAALLRKAGAQAVTGVALGKFGNQLRAYDIDIQSDPYQPIPAGKFKLVNSGTFPGATNPVSQKVLQSLIP